MHRLLKRQLKNANFSESQKNEMSEFLATINEAYISFDKDRIQLEHTLELSSQELYSSNIKLKKEVENSTREAHLAKVQLNSVVDNVKEIIYEIDLQGNFVYLNSAWEETTGYKVSESIGGHFTSFFKNIDQRDLPGLIELQNVTEGTVSKIFRTNDGSVTKWFELSASHRLDENQVPFGFIGTIVDITSLKEAELELIEANKVKDNFLSSMSHEMRTPLNAVIGISNILLMDNPKEEQLENLNALKFSSKHLLNLINDILDYSKLNVGKLKLYQENFDLHNMILGLEKSFSYYAEDKGLDFVFDIDRNIPKYVIGDSLRLSQILTNLINNAIKFTDKGSVKCRLKLVKSCKEQTCIEFKVIDTGIGISDNNVQKVFERFIQAEDHTTKKFGGTGLGLSIVTKLLELLDSKLELETKLGQGSTFSFTAKFKASQLEESKVTESKESKQVDIKDLNVLIVEDNTMNVLVLKKYFKNWGVNSQVAENGAIAVEKVQASSFDLILMDLQMPVMDGYAASMAIRELGGSIYKKIPIIALSASVSNEVNDKVKAAGMSDYLSKPFNPEKLISMISEHCCSSNNRIQDNTKPINGMPARSLGLQV